MMMEGRVGHVELSLSGAFVPQARTPAEAEFAAGIDRWGTTVATAAEPCLIIDGASTILAVSPSAESLLGLGRPAETGGQPRPGGVVGRIDFTAGGGKLAEPEIERIPPLLAIKSGPLARCLVW